ncbi:MAG TPA: hypothetical protein VN408_12365 [Actinoplanes sp.]|nr:hypothetical protein [Actinoplanes sp.]
MGVRQFHACYSIVDDTLSALKGTDIRRWAACNKVELCFTPTTPTRALDK